MKRFSLGVTAAALLIVGAGTSAQLMEIPTGVASIKAANGRAVRVDLDGDGRKEQVSLQEPRQKRYDRNYRPFRIRVNGQVFNDVFTDSNVPGIGEETKLSLDFRLQNRRSRRRLLFLGGPTGYEATAYKIYEWRGGKIRRVLRESMQIGRIEDDGTLEQVVGYSWGYSYLPWRRDRDGMFRLVPRSSYPFYEGGSVVRHVTTRLAKSARLHQSPRTSSPTFVVPKGAIITFDAINSRQWMRARCGKRIGWLPGQTVDQSANTFPLMHAG